MENNLAKVRMQQQLMPIFIGSCPYNEKQIQFATKIKGKTESEFFVVILQLISHKKFENVLTL
jgi:hypothetical protein